MLHLDDGKKENGWRAPQTWQEVSDLHLWFSIVPSIGIMKKKYQLTEITIDSKCINVYRIIVFLKRFVKEVHDIIKSGRTQLN